MGSISSVNQVQAWRQTVTETACPTTKISAPIGREALKLAAAKLAASDAHDQFACGIRVGEPPRLFRRLCYVSPAAMTGAFCFW